MQQAEAPHPPTPSTDIGKAQPRAGLFATRRRRITAAVMVALVTGSMAIAQPPAPPAKRSPVSAVARWFFSPIVIGRELQTIGCDLRAVYAVDPQRIWVVGTLAFVARSEDGGITWTKEDAGESPGEAPKAPGHGAPAPPAGPKGALLDLLEGTAYAYDDPSGHEPKKEKKEKKAKKGQKAEHESDNTTSPVPPPVVIPPAPMKQTDVSQPPEPPDFLAIEMVTSGMTPPQGNSSGEILADDGSIYNRYTGDGGPIRWSRTKTGSTGRTFRGAQIQPPYAQMWDDGHSVEFEKDGFVLPERFTRGLGAFQAMTIFPPQSVFIVKQDGSIERHDVGETQKLAKPPGGDRIRGLFFRTADRGWAVGDGGLILATTDGAHGWTEQTSETTATLRGAFFLDSKRGWVVGDLGTVLGTGDGGQHWTTLTVPRTWDAQQASITRPLHLPAPWYWLSLVVLGLLIGTGLRAPAADDAAPEQTIANLFVTDRPVDDPQHDRLALNDVALGLSRFLRNDATLAPLTVAVTGDWGTGKSSLMKLLQTDLLHFGFRPVWFNAWHYQKEPHMLAGLLQAIRLQAVPGWLSVDGLRLRARLLLGRGLKFWLLVGFVAFLLALSIAFEVAVEHDRHFEGLKNLWNAVFDAADKKPGGLMQMLGMKPSDVGVLAGLAALFGTLQRGARAFGVDPAALLAGVSGSANPSALSSKTSFRQKFAEDLAGVTRALGTRKMIIFVDDLDRCRPERVVETLEAVNFVVSSGDCFVILGMAPERVIPCIALSFKDVAAEMRALPVSVPAAIAGAPAPDTAETARQKRARFAREYLDKLINIEVPVPTPTSAQAADLLLDETSSPEPAPSVPPNRRPLLARMAATAARAAIANKRLIPSMLLGGLMVSVVVLGAWLGYQNGQVQKQHDDGGENQPVAKASPAAPLVDGEIPESTLTFQRPDRKGQIAEVVGAGTRAANPTPVIVFAAIALLLVLSAWIVINRRPDPVVRDSEGFKAALRIWKDVVYARRATPRALKRFVNRVRYLAMGQRVERPAGSLLDRMLSAATGAGTPPTTPPDRKRAGAIDDPTLVALAAIDEVAGDAFVTAPDLEVPGLIARNASVRTAWDQHAATFEIDLAALERAAAAYAQQARSVRAS